MAKELVQINGGLTERGNLKRDVASQIREQAIENFLNGFEKTPKGEYVLAVAEVDGKTVYIRANLSVSIDEKIFDEPTPKATAPAKESVKIDNIFE